MSEKKPWFAILYCGSDHRHRLYLGEWGNEHAAELVFGAMVSNTHRSVSDLPGFLLVRSDSQRLPRQWVGVATIRLVTFEVGERPAFADEAV